MDVLFLDTETTGIPAAGQEPLHIVVLHLDGRVLFDSYVRPVRHERWDEAQAIHGITPEQVLRPEVPTLSELAPRLADVLRGHLLVIYNAAYDEQIIAEALALGPPAQIQCLMLAFAAHYGDWHEYYQNYTWQDLGRAAAYVLHEWTGPAHSALADNWASRAVWLYLNDDEVRLRIDTERARRQAVATEKREVRNFWEEQAVAERRRLQACNDAWTLRHFPEQLFPELWARRRAFLSASVSADAFSVHLTGFGLRMWALYGNRLLLPLYDKHDAPAHLVPGSNTVRGVHFLTGSSQRPVAAMQVLRRHQLKPGDLVAELSLLQLYDVTGLIEGVDYVPYVGQQPAGYLTKTELKRQYQLSPAQLRALRPGLVRRTRYGADCLLYAVDQLSATAPAC